MPDPTAPFRVLIADDTPAVRQALRWALEEAPEFELVGEAVDSQSALEQAERLAVDLVLVDVDLPGATHHELTRSLKALPTHPRVVCLAVNDDPDVQAWASSAGADSFVAKSAGWQALIDTLRQMVSNSR